MDQTAKESSMMLVLPQINVGLRMADQQNSVSEGKITFEMVFCGAPSVFAPLAGKLCYFFAHRSRD